MGAPGPDSGTWESTNQQSVNQRDIDYSAGKVPSTVRPAAAKAPKQRHRGDGGADAHRLRVDFSADRQRLKTGRRVTAPLFPDLEMGVVHDWGDQILGDAFPAKPSYERFADRRHCVHERCLPFASRTVLLVTPCPLRITNRAEFRPSGAPQFCRRQRSIQTARARRHGGVIHPTVWLV
jgi:hypothetical protein